MRPSSCVKDLTWSSLFGALMLSMVLGLSACSGGGSDSDDNFSPGGGDGLDGGDGGDGGDNLCENNPKNTCDFKVTLKDAGTTYYGYGYSYTNFTNTSGWSANGKEFSYLQTKQYEIGAGMLKNFNSMQIDDSKGYECAALYWKTEFKYVPMGRPFDIPSGWLDSAPLHMTMIPWNGDCSNGAPLSGETPDGTRALAIWISEAQQSQPAGGDCNFSKDSPRPACFAEPYWTVEDGYLIFKGSLVDRVMSGNANPTIPLNIYIDKSADLHNTPLSTFFYRYTIEDNSSVACQYFAENGTNAAGSECRVSSGEELTLLAKMQINVFGRGRINGFAQLSETIPIDPGKDQNGAPRTFTMNEINEAYAQYRLYSGLLVLSSGYNISSSATSAITVSGITVGFGPKRNAGAVQLNTPYARAASLLTDTNIGYDGNNAKVNVSDLKVVGNWIDAADGPEIMGQNSTVESLYLHVNDDSIKVAVNGIKISDVTVLQGDTGGVVDLGSYGYNRGSIKGAVVDGVYVHRITHTTGYDDYNGLVTTRLCPVKPLNDFNQSVSSLENATVQNLQVNKVGDINTVQRPAAIGVLANGGTASFCGTPTASMVTISNIRLLNWDVYVEPSEDSKLYNNGTVSRLNAENNAIQYKWVYPSVAFFDSNFLNNVPENAVRLYPANSVWYAACGLSTGSCYNENGPYSPGQPNVVTESINSDVPNFNYLFPYAKP